MTFEAFVARYPRFDEIDPDVVEAVIAEATLRHDVAVWGGKLQVGIGLMTAHLLWLEFPETGKDKDGTRRPGKNDGTSPYLGEWERMASRVGRANRVIPHEDEDTDG